MHLCCLEVTVIKNKLELNMKKHYVLTIVFFFALCLNTFSQSIKYVKFGGTGNGTSWANASGDLQAMIDISVENDSIWVAKGTYKPTKAPWPTTTDGEPATERDNAFVMKVGVKVFGGFAGTESSFGERNMILNETILSGDLNNDDLASDGDYYHIVVSSIGSDDAELNGFILQHGFANGTKTMGTTSSTTATSLSQGNGGAICTRGTNTSILFKNLIIRDNYAEAYGGAVYQRTGGTGKEFRWENVQFINNQAKNNAGGAMYTYPSINTPQLLLVNCIFDGNQANSSGGAIYHYGAVSSGFTVINSVVKNNKVGSSGAGFYITQSSSTNQAIVTNTTFDSNISSSTNSYGGHLYVNRNLLVTDSKFYNGSNSQGGAIYANSTATIAADNCHFEGNSSTSSSTTTTSGGGGAIYLGSNTTKPGAIKNSNFVNNSAGNLGGAIHFHTNSTSVLSCNFSKNTAALGGGAISVYGSSTAGTNLPVSNSLFYANEAKGTSSTWAGGAVFLRNYSSIQSINNTFYANKAVNAGGAVYQSNNDIFLTGSSGVKKSAIYNSLFFGNTATNQADIALIGSNSLIMKNSLTQLFGVDGEDDNIVGVDPAFESIDDTNAKFLRLSGTSRAINMGESSFLSDTVATDLQGNARVIYDFLDLGAYEYDGTLANLIAFNINENSSVGTSVGTLTRNLPGVLNWQILSGNLGDTFSINSVTGELNVADNTLLDYETKKAFRFRIQVSNGSTTQVFTAFIVVINLMEDPGTPILTNKINAEVRSYFPRLEGKAEPLSTVLIYMDNVLTPYTSQTNARGEWNIKFTDQIASGVHSFHIVTENNLGRSNASAKVSANFILYPGVVVPNNILTPNGDGKNDVWIIKYLSAMYPNHEILVYDKVGKIVFQWSSKAKGPYDSNNDYGNAWNGSFNGATLNSGTYYYDINIGTGLDRVKGTITILRGR